MGELVIVGGGFAGVWAALGAAQVRELQASGRADPSITLVSRDPWLTIRPRLYEPSLEGMRVPLDEVLEPLGVSRVEGEVTGLDPAERAVTVRHAAGRRRQQSDVLAQARVRREASQRGEAGGRQMGELRLGTVDRQRQVVVEGRPLSHVELTP